MAEHNFLFDVERTPVTVEYNGKKLTLYARKMGYYEYNLLNLTLARAHQGDMHMQGVSMLLEVAARSLYANPMETKGEQPVFTVEQLKRLPQEVIDPLTDAAMNAQGIDMSKARESGDSSDEATDPGNE